MSAISAGRGQNGIVLMGFAHSIGEYVNAMVFGCSSCIQEVSLLHHNQLQIPISAHIICRMDLFLDCQIRSGRNGAFFCLIGDNRW